MTSLYPVAVFRLGELVGGIEKSHDCAETRWIHPPGSVIPPVAILDAHLQKSQSCANRAEQMVAFWCEGAGASERAGAEPGRQWNDVAVGVVERDFEFRNLASRVESSWLREFPAERHRASST